MDAIVSHLFSVFIRLGALGLLLMGVLDSSFLFMPFGNDLLVVALTARQHRMLPVYAVMASAGSVLGCWLVDRIARKGGEAGLHRFVSRHQIEFVKRRVRSSAGWAVALASIMPPPFPFTPIVAAASAFQYPARKLFVIIAATRFLRFLAIGLLAIALGQRLLDFANSTAVRTAILALAVICVVGSVISIVSWIRGAKESGSSGLSAADTPSRT